jgi:exoribonuclease-2
LNVFYEEDGGFKVGAVMADSGSSLQVEAAHGKRSKIKAVHVLLKFELPLAGFMEQAQAESETLDVDFLWQCCGENDFSFEDLAREYYGKAPTAINAAAVALRLHSAPIFFYRKGKGRYKAASAENLKAALAAQERKRQQALKIGEYVEQLKAHQLPPDFKEQLDQLLHEPDKNSLAYKALDEAATACGMLHIKLLEACGALPSAHDYHLGAFLREHFPAGVDFPPHPSPLAPDDLPQAEAPVFSIDDATTTEIDDAFSVLRLPNGNTRVGIHIAAPGLGIKEGT